MYIISSNVRVNIFYKLRIGRGHLKRICFLLHRDVLKPLAYYFLNVHYCVLHLLS